MAAPVLQFKRGLLANLPGLRVGEPGFTTDSYDLYVGLTSETATNKFFGSHRYWTKETTSTGSGINVVEGTSNGSSYITLKSPDSLAGIVTYTLPGTDGSASQVLATNGSGTLSFIDAVASLDIAGDSGTDTVDLLTDTLSFVGTTAEIVTAVTNNQVQIGLPDNVIIGAGLTVTGALDVNGGGTIDNIQIGVTGDNEIDTTSGNLTIDSAGGTTTIDDELIVSGDIRINGNDIKSSDGNTNITLTSNTLTTFAGDIKVTGNDIQSSSATAITLSGTDVTVAGDLTVGGNDIKASDGTTALTLVNTTGAVQTNSDLTVSGNLYVSGNTTQVNTAALTVEDRTIDLGIVNGATPASATTWDLGVLFNYHAGGSAKKSAVVWEHADTRFKFASVLAADTNGSDVDTPQLTVTTFAPIEIGALWVTDCAGTSQVISCTGSERFLENITIDAGQF